jgi:hypothetical protein
MPFPKTARRRAGGTYLTRPVEAAVAAWLQRYATQLAEATKVALEQAPKRQQRHPQEAERRRLTKVLDDAHGRKNRLLDVYVNQGLNRDAYMRRLAEIQEDVDSAQHRFAALDAAPAQEPTAPVVGSFADTWPAFSVEVRRDVAGALLTSVRVVSTRRWRSFRDGASPWRSPSPSAAACRTCRPDRTRSATACTEAERATSASGQQLQQGRRRTATAFERWG